MSLDALNYGRGSEYIKSQEIQRVACQIDASKKKLANRVAGEILLFCNLYLAAPTESLLFELYRGLATRCVKRVQRGVPREARDSLRDSYSHEN